MKFLHSTIIALAVVSTTFGTLAIAQSTDARTNWRVERAKLDQEFVDRLKKIVDWCRENDATELIRETVKFYHPRDLERQSIFLPPEDFMPTVSEDDSETLRTWRTQLNEVRRWQAERIFELARNATDAGAGGAGFQLLNEVLYFDRDHARVREILGHRKTDDSWRVAPDRIKIRPATRQHDVFGWPAKTYLMATSSNFQIESNASEERTKYLAENLERWHAVWRQVFFEYWSSADALHRWIDGKSSYRHSRRRFHVIFFEHRENYLAHLANRVQGIGASTGYYSSDMRTSFFYDDADGSVQDTWRHELTHQLFRESVNTGDDLFEEEFIWLDEGIATYFESLTDFGDYVTLGGFDSRRMQYARIRLLLEGYYVPLKQLSSVGRGQLQAHGEMARLYSQLAGVTEMLMNDDRGEMAPRLIEFLELIYRGRRIKPGAFEELLGASYDELDQQYKKFLVVDSETVQRYLSRPEIRTELSVARADLQDEAFAEIGKCINLGWLDLSRNTITSTRIQSLAKCQRLAQLFLTECPLAEGALKALEQFDALEELDLSSSSVSDEQLSELTGLENLRTLRLANTRVTNGGLAAIAEIPRLTTLDVTNTKITDAGITRLKQHRPSLKIRK